MAARHAEPVHLPTEAGALLEQARQANAGRAARTLTPRQDATMTQTLLALTAGQSLNEHANPGMATLLVLRGRIRLHAGDEAVEADESGWLPIPPQPHSVEALDDAVMLLTATTQAS